MCWIPGTSGGGGLAIYCERRGTGSMSVVSIGAVDLHARVRYFVGFRSPCGYNRRGCTCFPQFNGEVVLPGSLSTSRWYETRSHADRPSRETNPSRNLERRCWRPLEYAKSLQKPSNLTLSESYFKPLPITILTRST